MQICPGLWDLSLKLVTLLGLVAPSRGAELAELDVKNMSKTKPTYVFYLLTKKLQTRQAEQTN
jgi:hypothetical protein